MEFFDTFESIEDGGSSSDNLEHNIESHVRLECEEQEVEFQLATASSQIEGLSNNVSVPRIGMEFPTPEHAYDFYNSYAKNKGFGIRKYSTRMSKRTGEVISRIYVCNKEGFKRVKEDDNVTSRKRESRVGCNARMIIGLTEEGTWTIKGFDDMHLNHELTSPSKIMKHRSHSQLHRTGACKILIDGLSKKGLRPSIISRVVNEINGNQQDKVTAQQCIDHLRKERRNNIGHECIAIINHFQDKKVVDPDFYFSMQVDDDQTLRSVFWADGRSRTNYLQFGDVIVFDVTYKTNKFELPFAPFTGVNHHRQSTLFGCALLADEQEVTFTWLFKEWLKCMWGKAPVAIITDQDAAICNAIKRVFPETRHRYCSWHISKHENEHMVPYKSIHGDQFEKDYKKWCRNNTIFGFEKSWEEFKDMYNLDPKSWFGKMFEKRHHWGSCYLKDTFFAGMTTSQRSESMNSFFDGYVNSLTPLDKFVKRYDDAMVSRREKELNEDFHTINTKPSLISTFSIEAQVGDYYTRKIFTIFQKELKDSQQCLLKHISKEGSLIKYLVGLNNEPITSWKLVSYDDVGSAEFVCDCAKFETEGILCKHILHIIIYICQFLEIPDRYILKRWTINVRYQVSSIGCGVLESNNTNIHTDVSIFMRWSLRAKFNKVMEKADNSITVHQDMDSYLSNLLLKLEKDKGKEMVESIPASQVESTTSILPEVTVRDPDGPVKRKGRPKIATRFQSGFEQSQVQGQKKKKKCGNCGELGHYRTGCIKAKMNAGDFSSFAS